MATWRVILGDWGQHVADVPLADAWVAEWRRRVAAARPLVALGSSTPWAAQRDAIRGAWEAASNVYKAANIPPPSDPLYRLTIWNWYRQCRTTSADLTLFRVGPLVSLGGGAMSKALWPIWFHAKNPANAPVDPPNGALLGPTAVRLSLGSDGNVASMCLEATGEGDCSYRGLYTGCANTVSPPSLSVFGVPMHGLVLAGQYREVSCDAPYSAETFEWFDGLPQAHYSPPLRLSLDVLAELLEAFTRRGGALEAIDAERTFVLVSNLSNAAKAGILPSELIQQSLTLTAAAARLSTGASVERATATTAIGIATAACSAAAGPFAPACAAVGGIAALITQIWPVAMGVQVDALGMPILEAAQSSAFLPQMIAVPDARGGVAIEVPDAPTGGGLIVSNRERFTLAPGTVLELTPDSVAPARRASAQLSAQRSQGTSPALIAAGILLAVVALGKGMK